MLSGVRSSRLRDREKERELLIKKAFLNDMTDENLKLHLLLEKESIPFVVLWEPELLPSSSNVSQLNSSSAFHQTPQSVIDAKQGSDVMCCNSKSKNLCDTVSEKCQEKQMLCSGTANLTSISLHSFSSSMTEKEADTGCPSSDEGTLGMIDDEEEEEEEERLPFGLNVDSGTLACVACGVLGFPFMAIVQPPVVDMKELFSLSNNESHQKPEKSGWLKPCLPYLQKAVKFGSVDTKNSGLEFEEQLHQESGSNPSSSQLCGHVPATFCQSSGCSSKILKNVIQGSASSVAKLTKVTCGKSGDTESGYIKPRIFCLQHAIEIADLLRCKGGAHVLIICHSDYLKIKALAIAVAEEIGMQFNFQDFPIEDASAADLDLINVSIDGGEEHEDWTSKLGINLRYFIKLRKQLSSNQEPLPLSLSKLFSGPSSLSVVSSLKWNSRKSRTPYKVVGKLFSKAHIMADTENEVLRNSKPNFVKAIQVFQSHKKGSSVFTIKHPGQHLKGRLEESCATSGTKVADKGNDNSKASGFSLYKDNMEPFCTESLVTVPVLAAERLHRHQNSWSTQKTNTPWVVGGSLDSGKFDVHVTSLVKDCEGDQVHNSNEEASRTLCCESVKPGFCLSSLDVSVIENAEVHQNVLAEDVVASGCRSNDFKEKECEVNIVVQEVECLEVFKEILDVDENYPFKFDRTQAPGNKPTPVKNNSAHEKLEVNDLAHSTGLVDNLPESVLKVDRSTPLLVSYNNSVQLESLEVSASELVNSEVDICCKPTNLESVIDDSEPQQNSILDSGDNNVQCNIKDHDLHLGGKFVIDKPEIWQKISAPVDAEVNGSMESQGYTISQSIVETSEIPLDASNFVECMDLTQDTVEWGHSVEKIKSLVTPELNNDTVGVNSVPEDVSFQNGVKTANDRPIIVYKRAERPKKKQKIEEELMANVHQTCNEFIRSPCEGLRPRTGRAAVGTTDVGAEEMVVGNIMKKQGKPVGQSIRQKAEGTYKCEIEGCRIRFRTKRELDRHQDNRCIFKGCGKTFSSHSLAMRHQRAHEDERPLKCPWKGCGMSFKWAWARTEHVRLHTGERPYKCKVAGCGLTFRFVSDFSRHRRKTGHSGNSNT